MYNIKMIIILLISFYTNTVQKHYCCVIIENIKWNERDKCTIYFWITFKLIFGIFWSIISGVFFLRYFELYTISSGIFSAAYEMCTYCRNTCNNQSKLLWLFFLFDLFLYHVWFLPIRLLSIRHVLLAVNQFVLVYSL